MRELESELQNGSILAKGVGECERGQCGVEVGETNFVMVRPQGCVKVLDGEGMGSVKRSEVAEVRE